MGARLMVLVPHCPLPEHPSARCPLVHPVSGIRPEIWLHPRGGGCLAIGAMGPRRIGHAWGD